MGKLRKVSYIDRLTGQGYEVWFHCFTKDGTAVVEDAAGQVRTVEANTIRFMDRVSSTEFGGAAQIHPASAAAELPPARRGLLGRERRPR